MKSHAGHIRTTNTINSFVVVIVQKKKNNQTKTISEDFLFYSFD